MLKSIRLHLEKRTEQFFAPVIGFLVGHLDVSLGVCTCLLRGVFLLPPFVPELGEVDLPQRF